MSTIHLLYLALLLTDFLVSLLSKRGLILNVGSFAGQFPTPLLATYSGTKSFLIAFSQTLGEELRRSKIDVQCLNTYFVVSNMSKIRKSSSIVPTPRQYVQKVLSKIGRSGGAVGRPFTMTIWPMHALIDWALETFVGNQKWFFRYNYGENKSYFFFAVSSYPLDSFSRSLFASTRHVSCNSKASSEESRKAGKGSMSANSFDINLSH